MILFLLKTKCASGESDRGGSSEGQVRQIGVASGGCLAFLGTMLALLLFWRKSGGKEATTAVAAPAPAPAPALKSRVKRTTRNPEAAEEGNKKVTLFFGSQHKDSRQV